MSKAKPAQVENKKKHFQNTKNKKYSMRKTLNTESAGAANHVRVGQGQRQACLSL